MPKESHHHVIKDPIHGVMQWEHPIYKNIVKPIIDVPAFQRLRYIYQLGMTDKVFPGSTHTRFAHSLGCCHIANRIFHKLFTPLLTTENIELNQETYNQLETYTIVASLLHDIGHGPFSHAFERFFKKKFDDKFDNFQISHEEWTRNFLFKDMKPILKSIFKNSPQKLDEHIENIYALISHDHTNLKVTDPSLKEWMPLVGDIISSQLDADRMDYLLRDGHFCGVAYGTFDLEWMLNSLSYEKTKNENHLSITRKGIGAVEHFLAARRLMTQNIYHHLKVKAEEEVMVELLLKLHNDKLKHLVSNNLFQFLNVIERIHQNTQKGESKEKEIEKQIIKESFDFYKKITDFDISDAIRDIIECENPNEKIREFQSFAKVLYYRNRWPIAWKLDTNRRGIIEIIDEAKKELHLEESEHWKLAIIEYPFKMLKTDQNPILVSDDYQTKLGSNLQGLSEFAKQMGDRPEMILFLSIHHELTGSDVIKKLHKRLLNEQFFALPPPLPPKKR